MLAGGGVAASADRSTTIWAEPETNALVITAPAKVMRSLWAVIDKLDIRRAQVLVEAIIVDVQVDKNAELGVNWAVWSDENNTRIPAGAFLSPVGGVNLAQLAQAVDNPSAVPAGSIPAGTTFGVGRIAATGVNFAAMIRALQGDSNTNLISTPSAVTMDNQEAQLKVAQEVPFITGQFTNTGSTNNGEVNPFTTVQRQEVGTILKITPQINEGGKLVQLKIEIESSALSGTTGDANSAITNKRTISTNVLIEDGGIVVLGGLIQDGDTRGEQRVPYLGRIPIIGELFKTRSRHAEKKNLMVFIRPKILLDGYTTAIETGAKYNYMRSEQEKSGRSKAEVLPLIPFAPEPTPAAAAAAAAAGARARRRHRARRCAGDDAVEYAASGRSATGQRAERHGTATAQAMNDAAASTIAAPRRIGFAFAKRHGVLVRRVHEGIAECVYRPGALPLAVAEVRRYLGVPLRLEKVEESYFDSLLRQAYEAGNDAMEAATGVEESTDLAHLAQELPEQADLLESEDDAPIIRLINAVLTQAVKENASDIHVEPFENRLVVRFRVDGVLREVLQSKRAVAPLVVSRIKVMSKLDIAEKRLPQDGRISLRIAGRSVDVRVSTIPSGHGERVVLRILDKQAGRLNLSALGMDPKTEQMIGELFRKPHGIILVTGPTGSGKTTTLYAGLEHLNDNIAEHHDGRGSRSSTTSTASARPRSTPRSK